MRCVDSWSLFCRAAVASIAMALAAPSFSLDSAAAHTAAANPASTTYHVIKVDGVDIFYREAGPISAPTILLLHGFPSSSHMFRELLPRLSDRYHLVAPDYPGFGQSGMPLVDKFSYTFDRLSDIVDKFTSQIGLKTYSMYVADYGAPIGYRIAAAHPERIESIIVQNGNAYAEGIANPFWDPMRALWADKSDANKERLKAALEPETTRWFYTDGVHDLAHISPDTWTLDQAYLDRPGNKEIQLELLYSYGSNTLRYAEWQAYFRKYRPAMLIVWGKNDKSFPVIAATSYLRDLPDAEMHLLDTGHFALEEDGEEIARLMREFLRSHVDVAARHP